MAQMEIRLYAPAIDIRSGTYSLLRLGSVVVFATTVFALWMGVRSGAAAIVIVQSGIFAEASRQLVR